MATVELHQKRTTMTPEQMAADEAMMDLELALERSFRMADRAAKAAKKLDPHCRAMVLAEVKATLDSFEDSRRSI
jgi:hypothetical protein